MPAKKYAAKLLLHAQAIAAAEALGLNTLAEKLRQDEIEYEEDLAPLTRRLRSRAPAAMLRTEAERAEMAAPDKMLDDQAVVLKLHDWAIKKLTERGHDMMYLIGPANEPVVAWSGSMSQGEPLDRFKAAKSNNPQGLHMYLFTIVTSMGS